MNGWKHPRPGIEVDWLAIDVNGRVGLFATGGYGPVPQAVIDRLCDVEAATAHIAELPINGECQQPPDDAGGVNHSFWIEPARRGLFGFDWGPVATPPYARLTVPSNPIHVSSLPTKMRDAARLAPLAVDFVKQSRLDVDDLGVLFFGAAG